MLYEARDAIRTIHTRHEQAAGYMALGYAQASGRVGACIIGPGPGLLNAGAAIATASGSNAPVLCIAGQIPSSQIGGGMGMTHEIRDQTAAMRGVAKWVGRAETPADAPDVLHEAFEQMLGDRHQPVVFEMAPTSWAPRMISLCRAPDPTATTGGAGSGHPRRGGGTSRAGGKAGDLRRQRYLRSRDGAAAGCRTVGGAGHHEPHLTGRC